MLERKKKVDNPTYFLFLNFSLLDVKYEYVGSDSTDGTDTETPLALPRKKLKELKKMEKRRRNSMNVIIMDSFNKTFYISKSTLGRIRPLVRCADACILGLKYISSPILLPMYIAYALMNPAVKDAKVEVSENHGDSPKSDDGSRERKLAPGKMRRSQERNVIHEADEFAEEDSSNQIDLKSNTTHSVNTLKSTHTSLESHAESPSANVATPTNVGKKSPEEAYIGKNGTKSELSVAEFSKGVEKDSKHARTVVQKISGPALRDLSSSRHQGYFAFRT